MNVLPLAFNLAILTYFIGVLILALPIPYRQLKKWGVRLMSDAIIAAVLVSAYSMILGIGDLILNMLGYSWTGFMAWLTERTAILVTALVGLTYLTSWIKSLGYSLVLSPLGLASTYITLALSAIRMMYFIASFIWSFRGEFLALGLLLYSLPFRVGKGVGAFFIAASLILYVGFPLMPAFVNVFQTAVPEPMVSNKSFTITCSIVDVGGEPLQYPVIRIYKEGSTIPLGVVKGDDKGTVVLGGDKDIIPRNYTFDVEVLFMGYIFKPSPRVLRILPNKTSYKLGVRNIIYQGGLAILIPSSFDIINIKYLGDELITTVSVLHEAINEIRVVKLDNVRIYSLRINGHEIHCSWSTWEWNGISLSECVLNLSNIQLSSSGKITISVFYEPKNYPEPEVEERRVVCYESLVDIIMQYVSVGIAYIYTFLFLPGLYLAALTAMSASLARVIGGGIKLRFI